MIGKLQVVSYFSISAYIFSFVYVGVLIHHWMLCKTTVVKKDQMHRLSFAAVILHCLYVDVVFFSHRPHLLGDF